MQKSSLTEVKAQAIASLVNQPKTKGGRSPLVGIGRSLANGENKLAVRLYGNKYVARRRLGGWVEWLTNLVKGETDVQYVGNVQAFGNAPWYQTRVRPLAIGSSFGHFSITCGTLGCFVSDSDGVYALTNNHVAAASNKAKLGDAVYQPGPHDGGKESDTAANLTRFIKIENQGNLVDCAISKLVDDVEYDFSAIRDLGTLSGLFDGELEPGDQVCKLGRTTGATLGRVTAVEMSGVAVGGYFDNGTPAVFDDQIEIEGAETTSFSAGGDSGSMVLTAKEGRKGEHFACGLLFAGGPYGGSNGQGLTYVNDIKNVLKALKVELVH